MIGPLGAVRQHVNQHQINPMAMRRSIIVHIVVVDNFIGPPSSVYDFGFHRNALAG